jgi:hypothetical protein
MNSYQKCGFALSAAIYILSSVSTDAEARGFGGRVSIAPHLPNLRPLTAFKLKNFSIPSLQCCNGKHINLNPQPLPPFKASDTLSKDAQGSANSSLECCNGKHINLNPQPLPPFKASDTLSNDTQESAVSSLQCCNGKHLSLNPQPLPSLFNAGQTGETDF